MSGPIVRVERDEPVTLLLLHGLAATGGVWEPLIDHLGRDGRFSWIVPDLPGHGQALRSDRYSYGMMAAEVARAVPDGQRVVVVGHSLGGVVGLALASGWFGVEVEQVIGIGVKLSWTGSEVDDARGRARRVPQVFKEKAQAVERYLRVAGLTGLVSANSAIAHQGVVPVEGGWSLAWDPRTAGMGATPAESLLQAASPCSTVFARGDDDAIAGREDGVEWGARHRIIDGGGHNIHVEAPGQVFRFIEAQLAPAHS